MTNFIVRGIDLQLATLVRTTRRAPNYGHPVHREVASGTGPCREYLRSFTVGSDDRLLFTYNPFNSVDHLPQPGPVFIHAQECVPHTAPGYPDGLTALPIVAERHRGDSTVLAPSALVRGGEAAELEALLADAGVRFVHLRHAEAGCFIARVDRLASEGPLWSKPESTDHEQ